MPEKSSKQTSPRKQETRPRCKYCKNFGHTVNDCRTARKKRDEGTAALSKKNRDEIDAETNSGNRHTQPVVICFDCGNPGYLRKACPKCNKKEKADKSEVRSDFCLIDVSEIQVKCKNRPIIDVEILGAKGTRLIDTAAELSVAGHSLYKILVEKGQKFKESNLRIGLADGRNYEEQVLVTEVDIYVMNRTVRTTFIVMPHAQNNFTLFGMNFIQNAKIVLNCPQRI